MTDPKTDSGQPPRQVSTNRQNRPPITGAVIASARSTGPKKRGVTGLTHSHVERKRLAASLRPGWDTLTSISNASHTRTTKLTQQTKFCRIEQIKLLFIIHKRKTTYFSSNLDTAPSLGR